MIKSLTIRNFQKHTQLKVNFDKQITTIVGPTDAGKSSFIRAFLWLATNRPSGESFRRQGSKKTGVRAVVDNHTITRTRGKTLNTYEVDGETSRAMGTKVPDVVSDALRLDAVNFQSQHDPPWWFTDTPGQVSSKLNEIVDLSMIDKATSFIASEVRKNAAKIGVVQERIADKTKEVASLQHVDQLDQDLKQLEKLGGQLGKIRGVTSTLGNLLQAAVVSQKEHKRLTVLFNLGEGVVLAGSLWQEVAQRRELLEELMWQGEEAKKEINTPVPNLTAIKKIVGDLVKLRRQRSAMEELLAQAKAASSSKKQLVSELATAQTVFEDTFKGACPLCGKNL